MTTPMTTAAGYRDLEFDLAPQRSLWQDAWDRFKRNRGGVIGLVVAILTLLLAIFGPMIAPYNYTLIELTKMAQPPSPAHWLGTDELGRDLLSRILVGARTAITVAFLVTGLTTLLGILIGSVAAYAGRHIDNLLMRITDIVMVFPGLMLAASINALVRTPLDAALARIYQSTGWSILQDKVMLDYVLVLGVLSLVWWPTQARLIRGQILSLREQDFIRAQYAMGASGWYIITRHLIPNALGPVIVSASGSFGGAMVMESALSYLGLGIQPPGASWGKMIADNMAAWGIHPHLVAVPSLVLAFCVFGFNFLGDGINDALNPRQTRR